MNAEHFLHLARQAKTDIELSGDRRLAEALLARTPTRAEYAPLFMEANSAQRTLILLAVQRAELGKPRGAPSPGAPPEAIARLERYALTGEAECSLPLWPSAGLLERVAERIAADRSGEPLAVDPGGDGAPNDVSVRILTSSDLRDGVDYRRIGALARLQDALSLSRRDAIVAAIIENPQNAVGRVPARRALRRRRLAPRSIADLAPRRFRRRARKPCRRRCSEGGEHSRF